MGGISSEEAAERTRILSEQIAAEYAITLPEAERRITDQMESNNRGARPLGQALRLTGLLLRRLSIR